MYIFMWTLLNVTYTQVYTLCGQAGQQGNSSAVTLHMPRLSAWLSDFMSTTMMSFSKAFLWLGYLCLMQNKILWKTFIAFIFPVCMKFHHNVLKNFRQLSQKCLFQNGKDFLGILQLKKKRKEGIILIDFSK